MKEKDSIYTVAKDLLSKYNGNFEKAVSAMKKLFLKDSDLVYKYRDEIFERAASAIVQSVFANQRSSLFKTVPTLPKGVSGEDQQGKLSDKVKVCIENEVELLLNMAFNVCKKQLRFARREDLAEEVNMFLIHACGNDSWAVFLNSIYEKLEEDQMVEEVLSEKDLQKIMDKTNRIINDKWGKRFVKVEAPKLV